MQPGISTALAKQVQCWEWVRSGHRAGATSCPSDGHSQPVGDNKHVHLLIFYTGISRDPLYQNWLNLQIQNMIAPNDKYWFTHAEKLLFPSQQGVWNVIRRAVFLPPYPFLRLSWDSDVQWFLDLHSALRSYPICASAFCQSPLQSTLRCLDQTCCWSKVILLSILCCSVMQLSL